MLKVFLLPSLRLILPPLNSSPFLPSETRLLSDQAPVSHRGGGDPIGRPGAWRGRGRGRPAADSQSEAAADSTDEGAPHISQRLGPSRSADAWFNAVMSTLVFVHLNALAALFSGGHVEPDETVSDILLSARFYIATGQFSIK